MSVKILDTIVEDKGLIDNGLTEDQVNRVKAMILAGSKGGIPCGLFPTSSTWHACRYR